MPRTRLVVCALSLACAALLVVGLTKLARAQQCACDDPRWCIDPAAAAQAKAAKKKRLAANGVPPRLQALVDRLPDCVGCIETSSDTVHVTWVEKSGRIRGFQWSRDMEYKLRKDLREKKIKAFYIHHSYRLDTQYCSCCGQKTEDERDDWNSKLEMNMDLVLAYEKPRDLGDDPPDLTDPEFEAGDLRDPGVGELPELVRPMTTMCPSCQELVDQRNDAAARANSTRRPIGQTRRNYLLMTDRLKQLEKEWDAVDKLADAPATRERRRQLDLDIGYAHEERSRYAKQMGELLRMRKEALDEVAALDEQIRACEKDCPQPEEQAEEGSEQPEEPATTDGAPEAGDTGVGANSWIDGSTGIAFRYRFTPEYGFQLGLGLQQTSSDGNTYRRLDSSLAGEYGLFYGGGTSLGVLLGLNLFRVSDPVEAHMLLTALIALRAELVLTSYLSTFVSMGVGFRLWNDDHPLSSLPPPLEHLNDNSVLDLGAADPLGCAGFTFWF